MFNILAELKEIFRSKLIVYILSRYVGYFILFLNSLLIARNLGIYFFGIYSFILIVVQYLNYANLGLPYSLNYYLSIESNTEKKNKVIQDTFILNFLISIIIVIISFLLVIFDIKLGTKFNLSKYYILVAIIGIIQLFIQIYLSICRTYAITRPIIFNQLVIPILQLPGFFFYESQDLLNYILITTLLSNLISLIYFHFSCQIKPRLKLRGLVYKELIIHGLNLLIYNVSYNLILTLGTTLVGLYFSVKEFAQYSFAASLSAACLMILGSVTYLFYSKILNKLSTINVQSEMDKFVNKLSKIYFESSLLLVLFIFNLMPILYYILPEYQPSGLIFKIILISYLIMSSVFGYNTLLVQTKRHVVLTKISILSIFSNAFLAYLFVLFKLPYYYMALSTLFSCLIFVLVVAKTVKTEFKSENGNLKLYLSNKYGIAILCFLTFYENTIFTTFVTLFYFLNRKNTILELIKYSMNIAKRKDVFQLD